MQELPSSITDKTNLPQKVVAFGLMAGTVYLAALAINAVAPTLILAMENIWYALAIGVPLVAVVGFVIMNPWFVWGLYKTLTWNLTKFFIKMDPLSVMDRYVDYLSMKRKNLEKSRLKLKGKATEVGRLIAQLKESIKDSLEQGVAAQKQNEGNIASLAGVKASTDQTTLNLYEPIYAKMVHNLEFLDELSENWDFSIKKLSYVIERKRTEYETLKEMAKALDQAAEFAKGDTEASKLYNESVKQLEAKVSSYVANIEDFEKKSQSVLGGIRVEKQRIQDSGLDAIEAYKKSGSLMLPDFSTITTMPNAKVLQPIPARSSKSTFFNQQNQTR